LVTIALERIVFFAAQFFFFIDSFAEIWDLSFGLLLIGLHEDAIAAHNFVFIDLYWNLLNPLLWSELEGKCNNQDGGGCKDALSELFSGDSSCLKNEGEPFAGGPLDEENHGEDKNEDNAVEELLEDIVLTWSNYTAVHCVEELEEHESSEDHSEVRLLCKRWAFFDGFSCSGWAVISCLNTLGVVKTVNCSSEPDDKEHNCDHPNCDSINLTPDGRG